MKPGPKPWKRKEDKVVHQGVALLPADVEWLRAEAARVAAPYALPSISAVIRRLIAEAREKDR